MWSWLVLFFSALVPVIFASVTSLPTSGTKPQSQVLPNAYIVELDGGSLSKRDVHNEFYQELERRGTNYNILAQYASPDVFNGAAVQVQDHSDIVSLASASNVIGVYPVRILWAPRNTTKHKPTGPQDPALPPDVIASHKMTGIDRLQAQGYSGKGVKVAVIDSGVDYTLANLGGGFGSGHKVYTGYDFVGDSYTGFNTPEPDNDPFDNCYGHGTSVASIIAGNYDATYGFTGVAPGALIGAYRVISCDGASSDAIVVQALLRAYADGNQVINLSIFGNLETGWAESVLAVVADRIAAKGVIVVAMEGNSQSRGPFFSSSPGTGRNVIAVGSVDSEQDEVWVATVSNGHANIPYISPIALNVPNNSPIYVPTDTSGCTPFTGPTNPSIYVYVVARGLCSFSTKIANVQAIGGQYLLVSNSQPGYLLVNLDGIQGGLISQADGAYLVSQNGTNIRLSFPHNQDAVVPNILTGGLESTFPSWGPTNELDIKPNVNGVGDAVFAAYPAALGNWTISIGTSFSTPLVSGAAALLLDAKGNNPITGLITSYAAKTLFEQTAVAAHQALDDSGPIVSMALEGSGLINAYNAVNTKTVIWPSQLLLNDTANAKYQQTIYVTNLSPSVQTYTVSHVPAATVQTWNGTQVSFTPILSNAAASVTFSATTFKVYPLLPYVLTVTFKPPTGVDASTFPVYSGQIVVSGSVDRVVASYLGLAASMKNMQVIDTSSFYFGVPLPLILENASGDIQSGPHNYTFVGPDYPQFYYRLTAGSPSVRVDLVSASTTFQPTYTDPWNKRAMPETGREAVALLPRHHRSRLRARAHHHQMSDVTRRTNLNLWTWLDPTATTSHGNTFAKVKVVGTLRQMPYASRNTADESILNGGYYLLDFSNPVFANGTVIPNGQYRILLRALKITGDPTLESDYESWLSPVVGFAR